RLSSNLFGNNSSAFSSENVSKAYILKACLSQCPPRSNAMYFPIVNESSGVHSNDSAPINVYSIGNVPFSVASSMYAFTPSLNHSSTANSSSEYNSKDFSAALLKPSVRKYLSLSSDAFPISSLKVPDACLRDKSICNIRLCACTYPCAVYKSC